MSWLEDHLPDTLKEALCEPDAPKIPKTTQIAQSVTGSSAAVPYSPLFIQKDPAPGYDAPPPSVLSDAVSGFLFDLRGKTNFDATLVGLQLKESLDALADSGMSEEKMARTAMKLSKQSPAQVVSVLQVLQTALVADKQQFEASMQKATAAEVVARQEKLAQLQSSIEEAESRLNAMRQEKSQVDAELQQKQNKISSARANYAAASEARNTELDKMISHYQSIPEGK